MEAALADVGITPIVIASPDAAEGAPPLTHGSCFVVKVHGDYLDARIKNTTEELSEYDPRINSILDRIFDEFGLIICGWSGSWDDALRAALERASTRRFGTFWVRRGNLAPEAEALVTLRGMTVIDATDADSFFSELREKVLAAEATHAPHPLSGPMAVATLKRYLQDPNRIIDLTDLVNREVERSRVQLLQGSFTVGVPYGGDELRRRVAEYEAISQVPLSLLVTLSRWGNAAHVDLIVRSIQRLSDRPPMEEGQFWPVWRELQKYPAAVLLYGVGIAALVSHRYELLARILTSVSVRDRLGNEARPAALELAMAAVFEGDTAQDLRPGENKWKTPESDHVHQVLREPLRDLIPGNDEYEIAFDRFEVFLSLVYADLYGGWGPVGRFAWKSGRLSAQPSGLSSFLEEVESEGDKWGPFVSGLFGASKERFQAAAEVITEAARLVARR